MRRFLTIIMMSVALVAMGCSADMEAGPAQPIAPPQPPKVPMSIEVGEHPDSNPSSRIALDGDRTSWQVGDHIAVKLVDMGGNIVAATFVIASADDITNEGKRAHFSGEVPVGEYKSMVALYPAPGMERNTTTLPLTQTDTDNLFMSGVVEEVTEQSPLLIEENPTVKPQVFMPFKHIMHKIDLKLQFLNDDNTAYDSSDFDPATGGAVREVVIEMMARGETGSIHFPLICTYDMLAQTLETEKTARANTLILRNHDFVANPTVSMLVFPQEFGDVRLTFDIYIDGVRRHRVEKPSADGMLRNFVMSRGKTTSVGLKINEGNMQTTENGELFGDGSDDDPYIISNLETLLRMKQMLNNSTDGLAGSRFIQIANVDLGEEEWTPSYNAFCGRYDGNGYTININNGIAPLDRSGLFSGLGNGEREDVVVENVNIVCNNQAVSGGQVVGLLAGTMKHGVLVSNCHVEGDFSNSKNGSQVAWGGLVGEATGGVIDLCSFRGNILSHVTSGQCYLGGIIAHMSGNALIINSFVSGSVGYDRADSGNTGSNVCGGFVGYNKEGNIVNCYASGRVFSRFRKSVPVGGFIGMNEAGYIANSYSIVDMTDPETGAVNKSTINGTFVGENGGGSFVQCFDATDKSVPAVGTGSSDGIEVCDYIDVALMTSLNEFAVANTPATTAAGVEIPYSPWALAYHGAKLGLIDNPEKVE